MNFVFLLIAAFLGALGLGYTKFFILEHLVQEIYTPDDKAWVIQVVGALMTLGPVLIYAISAPTVSIFKKKWVMAISATLAALLFVLAFYSNWAGTSWLYVGATGLIISVFGVAKMATIPIESQQSGKSTFLINGCLSIVFIIGMLAGFPLGIYSFETDPNQGIWIAVAIFGLAGFFPMFFNYPKEALKPFRKSTSILIEDSISLLFKYPLYLSSASLLWAIAGSASLAVTAYAEEKALGSTLQCTLMSMYSAIGIIIGNAVSTKLGKVRYNASSLSGLLFLILLIIIPIFVEVGSNIEIGLNPEKIADFLYLGLIAIMILLGACFGICTNLIDAEYFEKVGLDKKEGVGAALHSTTIAACTFLVGGFIGLCIYNDWLGIITQFIGLAIITAFSIALVILLAIQNGGLTQTLGFIFSTFCRLALKLRYNITVTGMDSIPNNGKGILFLPNHPAEIDPVIIGSLLWKNYQPRPIIDEAFFHMPLVNRIMETAKAFPMPDMQKGTGTFKKKRIGKTLNNLCHSLDNGDSVLMYPAGQLMRSGSESLGAASGTSHILNNTKDINIVCIRSTGLWGSSFSTALSEGQTPNLLATLKQSLKTLISNAIFFSPRRKVHIEISVPTPALNASMKNLEINKQLETFYNLKGEEPLTLVSSRLLYKKVPNLTHKTENETYDLSKIAPEEITEFNQKFASTFKYELSQIKPEKKLAEDLGMDSLTISELLIWLDEEYEINDIEISEIQTIADLIQAIYSEKPETLNTEKDHVTFNWKHNSPLTPSIHNETTIQNCFLKKCDEMGNSSAIADDISGLLSWKDLKIAVLLFSKIIKDLPGNNIGIMLPSSTTANIIILATQLAKKTPVMLNWTVGRKNLEHAQTIASLDTILTSSNFLDKVDNVEFGETEKYFLFLEDIKEQINLGEKINALLKAKKSATTLIKELDLNTVQENDPAVILFTSGSESAPKGVPLSHKNILTNTRGALEIFNYTTDTVLYGFLPAFHSFGFTITTMLPMLSGIRTVYHPNPTESRKLAWGCMHYQVTMMCGTPTFINGIIKASKDTQLDKLKYILTGAEKLPAQLRSDIESLPKAKVYEGYGITECSPVLSINRPEKTIEGVGQPFPSVELLIVDIETHKPLQQGERGLIFAHGPSVFSGYLNSDNNPFIEVNNKQWYNTADLGYFTEEGSLILAGRLKRFVKIGGEMISLPAMEDALSQKWPPNEEGPTLAIHANEIEGKRPVFYLFCSVKIETEEANSALKESGFSNLARINEIKQLDEIPKLGTGKTDYQSLKKLILY